MRQMGLQGAVRGRRFKKTTVVEAEQFIVRDANGDVDIEASAQLLNDVVEGWVREHPGQWMWFHKRWSLSNRRRANRWKAKSGSGRTKAGNAS